MATPFAINARTAVAATATSTSTSRVYFQDTENGIREVTYDNGNWTVSNDALFSAKRSTPLAVVSWDEGKQIRIYCVSSEGLLQEWCGINGSWSPGYLTKLEVRVAPNTSIAATNWDGPAIRVYCQEENSNAIQEYCVGNPWHRGATLPIADSGSNLASLSFKDGGRVHLRVYYQAPDLSLREHCYDGSWSEGGFNPGVAIKSSAIAATSWSGTGAGVQLRLFWQDNHGLLRGYRWSRVWESTGSLNLMPVGTHISAINWDSGSSVRVYYQANDGTITEEVTHSLRTTILQV
ncbi:fungal fucose-specific lectin domain-containing protein [Trichoderma compactum]